MYQQITIIGNLGADAEQRYTPNGTPVTSANVAVNETYTGKDGEKVTKTTWFHATFWNRLAEVAGEYLKKGQLVMLVGTVEARAYLNEKTGEPAASLGLRVNTLKMLGGKTGNGTSGNGDQYDDDIPF